MSGGEEPRRRGLGRGLSALLGDPEPSPIVEIYQPSGPTAAVQTPDELPGVNPIGRSLRVLPVEKLVPGKFQPRRVFNQQAIDDLMESVREKGVLMPILARRHPDQDGAFEIIAGERRWRAAQAAGLREVPVLVRELTDKEALEIALIENLQRQDLSPLEEAEGYRRLMDDFSHTQEELAKTVGKSRSHVANTMRLLALPDPVKEMLDQGSLTAGHARALLTAADPVGLARQVVAKGLNVRQVESLAQKAGLDPKPKVKPAKIVSAVSNKDADLLLLERDLGNLLGLTVTIETQGDAGTVSIAFTQLEQLDDIIHRLSGGQPAHAMELPDNDPLLGGDDMPDTEFGMELGD